MAKPTPEQIKALEQAHAQQFIYLVQANNLILNGSKANKDLYKNPEFLKYIKYIEALKQGWQQRQDYYQTLLKLPVFRPLFFSFANQDKLIEQANAANDQATGPAGIGRITFFEFLQAAGNPSLGIVLESANFIQDTYKALKEANELTARTFESCAKLGMSKEECQALVMKGFKEIAPKPDEGIFSGVKNLFGDIGTLAKWGVGAFIAIKLLQSYNQTKTKI
jgi:hypothetical protein